MAYSIRTGKRRKHIIDSEDTKWLQDVDVFSTDKLIIMTKEKGFFVINNRSSYHIQHYPILDSLRKINKGYAFSFQRWDVNTWSLIFNNGNIYNFSPSHNKVVLLCTAPHMIPHYYRPMIKNIHRQYGLIFSHNGLSLINNYNAGISVALKRSRDEISTRNIIEDSKGNLYVGSYKGLYSFDKEKNRWINYSSFSYDTNHNKKQSMIPFSLCEANGFLYIGSEGYPFYRFNLTTRKFENSFYRHPDFISRYIWSVNCIFPLDNNKLLLGYTRGLAIYNIKKKTLSIIQNKAWNQRENTVYVVRPCGQDSLLIGTNVGAFKVDRHNLQATLFTNTIIESVYDILYLPEHKEIWIATSSKGIFVLDKKGQLKQHLTVKDGLPHTNIVGLTKAINGGVWIMTNNGLSKYDKGKFVNYYAQDGLSDNELNRSSYFNNGNGKIYIGSINGISIIDEKKLEPPIDDRIYISQIKIWRGKLSRYEIFPLNCIPEIKKITVHPGDKGLVISLGSSNLTNHGNLRFEYRIREVSDEWSTSGNDGELRFDGLSYGKLHLEIRAINRNNVESRNILHLILDVHVPFYQSVYFYIILSSIVIVLVLFFIMQKVAVEKKLNTQRLVIAKTLHDELGVLLTAAKFKIEYLLTKEKLTSNQLQDIYALSKEASTVVYETLWVIDSNQDSLDDLKEKILELNNLVLVPANTKFTIELDMSTSLHMLSPLVKQQLYYIYKEAINNIAKHSKNADAIITIKIGKGKIYMNFVNNNIVSSGLPSNKIGLKSIQQRADTINCHAQYGKNGDLFTLCIQRNHTKQN